VTMPFALQPGGRALWLQTVVPPALEGLVAAGWRDIRITHASETDHSMPPPFGRGLQLLGRSVESPSSESVWYGRVPGAPASEEWHQVPAENWRLHSGKWQVKVAVELTPNPVNPADPVVVTLAWYRAGRFEIMKEQMLDLRKTRQITLEARAPEAVGWVGLLTRPAGGEGAGHSAKIISWEAN